MVLDNEGEAVEVRLGVRVGVGVLVGVLVELGVWVGVLVALRVRVGVLVALRVVVAVLVLLGVPVLDAARNTLSWLGAFCLVPSSSSYHACGGGGSRSWAGDRAQTTAIDRHVASRQVNASLFIFGGKLK